MRSRAKHLRPDPEGDIAEPDFLISKHEAYPQIEPGEYELLCTQAKVYFDPGLKVWKCHCRFIHPLDSDFPAVFSFANFGHEPKSPGRRSRYFHEWTIASGGMPSKRQRMTARIFVGTLLRVHIDWVQKQRHDGLEHTTETRYSLVKAIKARIGP